MFIVLDYSLYVCVCVCVGGDKNRENDAESHVVVLLTRRVDHLLWKSDLYFAGDRRCFFERSCDRVRSQARWQIGAGCTASGRSVQRASLGFCDSMLDRYDGHGDRPESNTATVL